MKKLIVALIFLTILSFAVNSVYAAGIHNDTKTGNLVKVKEILRKNPKVVNEKDSYGYSPLHRASRDTLRWLSFCWITAPR